MMPLGKKIKQNHVDNLVTLISLTVTGRFKDYRVYLTAKSLNNISTSQNSNFLYVWHLIDSVAIKEVKRVIYLLKVKI